MEHVQKL
jgi:hypothetical protein